MPLSTFKKFGLGLGLGLPLGWFIAQMAWVVARLARIDPAASLAQHANRGEPGSRLLADQETEKYVMRHTVEDGIERIVYTPRQRKHVTPILMQHGMFHGAWTWPWWQPLFAEWGWESVAVSLPGHSASPVQRRIELCTLDYYLGFLKAEVDRLEQPPVLMGHSMSGALTQWYLKYCTDGALITPEELYDRLGPESQIVVLQHNPPFWTPPDDVRTPLLWVTGEKDAVISMPWATRSAEFYQAEHLIVPEAGHNLMMEKRYRETVRSIADWLEGLELP